MSIILALLTFVMFILALGIIGLVLLQKSSGQQGMGAAMGGGVADQAFGAETNSILSKNTQIATIIYFVLAFVLYLGYQSMYADEESAEGTGLLDAAIQEEAAVESEEAIGTEEVDAATIEEVVDSVEEATTVNPLEDTIEPQE
ncbi:MAG: preprotein translocase subunit SecG [Verrucomicrobiota bacterium]